MNVVAIVGRLVRDPELKYMPDGSPVAEMRVAVPRAGKRQDDGQFAAGFFDVSLFGRQAEVATQYLTKGREAAFEGYLHFDEWESNEGGKRSKVSIRGSRMTLIGSRDDNEGGGAPAGHDNPADSQPTADDDIPF